MDDILSQIIAYAPDRIDTETKARALVPGPRIPFDNGGDAFKLKKLQEDYDNFGKKELNKAAKTLGFKNYESMSGVENSNFRSLENGRQEKILILEFWKTALQEKILILEFWKRESPGKF